MSFGRLRVPRLLRRARTHAHVGNRRAEVSRPSPCRLTLSGEPVVGQASGGLGRVVAPPRSNGPPILCTFEKYWISSDFRCCLYAVCTDLQRVKTPRVPPPPRDVTSARVLHAEGPSQDRNCKDRPRPLSRESRAPPSPHRTGTRAPSRQSLPTRPAERSCSSSKTQALTRLSFCSQARARDGSPSLDALAVESTQRKIRCPPGPRRTFTFQPGEYSAVARSPGHGITPWAGDWSFGPGSRYSDCFYVVTSLSLR
jgi:hypothetical protein